MSSSGSELVSFLQSIESAREKAKSDGNYRGAIKEYEQGLQQLGKLLSSSNDRYRDRLVELRSKLKTELTILYDLTEELSSLRNCTVIMTEPQRSDEEFARDPDVWLPAAPLNADRDRPANRIDTRQDRNQDRNLQSNNNPKNQNDLPPWAKGKDADNNNDHITRSNSVAALPKKPYDFANSRDSRGKTHPNI